MFAIAKLSLGQAAEGAEWLVDDKSENYVPMDAVDLPDEYLERVFELYQKTYSGYGEPFITDAFQLFKYHRWILIFKGEGDGAKNIVAFALFTESDNGLKGGLKGSDLERSSRAAVKSFAIGSYSANGVYGEISGRLEKAIVESVPVVAFAIARDVLANQGKEIQQTKDNHYTREIRNIGVVEKIMVGRPIFTMPEAE